MTRCVPLPIALSRTRPPALFRQCSFIYFGVVALEGGLKEGDGTFFGWICSKSISLALAGFSVTKPSFKTK